MSFLGFPERGMIGRPIRPGTRGELSRRCEDDRATRSRVTSAFSEQLRLSVLESR